MFCPSKAGRKPQSKTRRKPQLKQINNKKITKKQKLAHKITRKMKNKKSINFVIIKLIICHR